MRPRIFIRGCVRPSISPSVGQSIGPLVGPSIGPSIRQSHTSWNHAKMPFSTKVTISTSEDASYAVYTALFFFTTQWIKQNMEMFFTALNILRNRPPSLATMVLFSWYSGLNSCTTCLSIRSFPSTAHSMLATHWLVQSCAQPRSLFVCLFIILFSSSWKYVPFSICSEP